MIDWITQYWVGFFFIIAMIAYFLVWAWIAWDCKNIKLCFKNTSLI